MKQNTTLKRKRRITLKAISARALKGSRTLNDASTLAKIIESLAEHEEAEELNKNAESASRLVRQILFDYGNETEVFATHPKLIRLYVLTMLEALPTIESEYHRRNIEEGFAHIRELLAGCSKKRFDEIDDKHNPDVEAHRTVFSDELRRQAVVEAKLQTLREQLTNLERLPENEAIALQLETAIYHLEHEDEWPDVIAEGGQDGSL